MNKGPVPVMARERTRVSPAPSPSACRGAVLLRLILSLVPAVLRAASLCCACVPGLLPRAHHPAGPAPELPVHTGLCSAELCREEQSPLVFCWPTCWAGECLDPQRGSLGVHTHTFFFAHHFVRRTVTPYSLRSWAQSS